MGGVYVKPRKSVHGIKPTNTKEIKNTLKKINNHTNKSPKSIPLMFHY